MEKWKKNQRVIVQKLKEENTFHSMFDDDDVCSNPNNRRSYYEFIFRLKSISSSENVGETPIPSRKRSHSVPMPKIEVTASLKHDEDADQKSPSGSIEPLDVASLLPTRYK